jgi:hypothetical protein
MKTVVLLLLASVAMGFLLGKGDGLPPKDCK